MYVLICKRVVKFNTGSTEKFSPRSANRAGLYVSGPFTSLRMAQRAAITALATHTCLDAQVWSERQVQAEAVKGSVRLGEERYDAMREAARLFEAAHIEVSS